MSYDRSRLRRDIAAQPSFQLYRIVIRCGQDEWRQGATLGGPLRDAAGRAFSPKRALT